MKKYFEPIIQLLFLMLSVMGVLIHLDAYASMEVYKELYLTNIINIAVVAIYLVVRLALRHKNHLESLQRGMLLYVIYNCLPIFFLMNTTITKILSMVCFFGALGLFIMKNLDKMQKTWMNKEMISGLRIILSIPLLVFGAGFLARGVNMIVLYMNGMANITEMFVSISDIIISVIWIPVAIGVLRKSFFGRSNVLACYILASLLFITLIVFLVINPLIFNMTLDFESVVIVLVMGLFFFIPTILLLIKE